LKRYKPGYRRDTVFRKEEILRRIYWQITKSLPAGLAPPKRLREGDAGRRHQFHHSLQNKNPQDVDLTDCQE